MNLCVAAVTSIMSLHWNVLVKVIPHTALWGCLLWERAARNALWALSYYRCLFQHLSFLGVFMSVFPQYILTKNQEVKCGWIYIGNQQADTCRTSSLWALGPPKKSLQ